MAADDTSSLSGSHQSFRTGERDARGRGICAFWLSGRCFGLELEIVGGVVPVERVIPVPRAPAPVLGLFNVRGTALALVDIAGVLELQQPDLDLSRPRSGLVIHTQGVRAAALIDRPEGVFMMGRDEFRVSESGNEHPAVRGVFQSEARGGLSVTVLDTAAVVSRLQRLSFRRAQGSSGQGGRGE